MTHQFDLFAGVSVVAVEISPICSYTKHCGARAEIGPCERVTAECCNHAIRCQRCGATGVESWNLLVGAKQHAKARPV